MYYALLPYPPYLRYRPSQFVDACGRKIVKVEKGMYSVYNCVKVKV